MSAVAQARQSLGADQDFVDQVIAKHRGRPGELLSILEELQEHNPHKYLTEDVLAYVAPAPSSTGRRCTASRPSSRCST